MHERRLWIVVLTGIPALDGLRHDGLVDDRGVPYAQFRRSLTPRYTRTWLELLAGHAGLALASAAIVASPPLGWLGTPLAIAAAAMVIGFGFAYIHLFFHEAAHYNLAADGRTNDRLANLFIGSLVGMDIAKYRPLHLEHHRALGTPRDTERSYFDAIDARLILESLTGIRLARVMRARRNASPSLTREDPDKQVMLGVLVHGGVVGAALGLGHWPLAAAWVGGLLSAFPFWMVVRQILEHRSEQASPDVDYADAPHGAHNRLFGDGPLASTLGAAGFNRHLLHHWDPQVPHTRLKELEAYLLRTPARAALRAHTTTYLRTFLELARPWKRA